MKTILFVLIVVVVWPWFTALGVRLAPQKKARGRRVGLSLSHDSSWHPSGGARGGGAVCLMKARKEVGQRAPLHPDNAHRMRLTLSSANTPVTSATLSVTSAT